MLTTAVPVAETRVCVSGLAGGVSGLASALRTVYRLNQWCKSQLDILFAS